MQQLCNMHLHQTAGVSYLTFPMLEALPFLRHSFSTRLGGVSRGCYDSLNLNFRRGDTDENVLENYRRICKAVGYDFSRLVASAQDHHTVIRHVTEQEAGIGITLPRDRESVDGLITNTKGITLVTSYADCVPLYFVDPVKRAIGLSHAGWRGTVAEIGKKTVEAMTSTFGTKPQDLLCAIGPSIGACCYEVDQPVIEAVQALSYVEQEAVLTPKGQDKAMLNLWEVNRQILLHSGVLPQHIAVGGVCTHCHPELFYSHRRMGANRGGMVAMLSLKEEV